MSHALGYEEIIRKFGLFPHRNSILGRESTVQEMEFLVSGGFVGCLDWHAPRKLLNLYCINSNNTSTDAALTMSTDWQNQYRIFIQVADMGSFTKAADAMNVPRATVSAVVQRLEQQLGTRLLNRTTRQVSLTPDGAQLINKLRALLDNAQQVEQSFSGNSHKVVGRLHVDVPSRIASKLIAPALPSLLHKHPQMQLFLSSSVVA